MAMPRKLVKKELTLPKSTKKKGKKHSKRNVKPKKKKNYQKQNADKKSANKQNADKQNADKENKSADKQKQKADTHMPVIRSSVRPASTRQPWGMILKPEFGLGYQKMTSYEVKQTVARLTSGKDKSRTPLNANKPQNKCLKKSGIDAMVTRLTEKKDLRVPESNRRQDNSIYKNAGILNSYAWKGYN